MSILARRGLVIALIGIAISTISIWRILTPASHPPATIFWTVFEWFRAVVGVATIVIGIFYDRLENRTGCRSGER